MTVRPIWALPITVSDGQTREDTRLGEGMLMTPDTPIKSLSGIRPGTSSGTQPFDLQSVSAMVCKITPGLAFIQGTAAQGGYKVYSDADKNLTFDPGHATNPRIDLVILRVYDNFNDSSGETKADIEIVKGTAASSPVAPALPSATSIPLWTVRVNANVSAGNGGINSNPGWTAARTDSRWYTVASGGILPAGGSWLGTYPGQYRDDGTGLQRWNGAAWKYPGPLGYLDSRNSELVTADKSGGPWLVTELGGMTRVWSSARRYQITLHATLMCWSGSANAAYLELRYKTGSSIPNDQNTSSSTLLRRRKAGFPGFQYATPCSLDYIFAPSVTETGTIGMFWTHEGTGTSRIERGMDIIIHDIGPQ
ncbi:hypothetical protein [Streptodolium elevatio]|uniref:Minor tail protein n=1 Tax=Streptodolium elevatio TaxID=3157996 RepID=A0ABV3DLE5_9ACTN